MSLALTSLRPRWAAVRRTRTALIAGAAAAAAAAVVSLTACEDADAQPDVAAASSAPASITSSVEVSSETALPPPTPLLKASDEDALRAAAATLDAIPVKGRAPKTGYDRALFGQAWSDDVTVEGGHNGCDTRNDILRRDLVDITIKPGPGPGRHHDQARIERLHRPDRNTERHLHRPVDRVHPR